MRESHKYQAFQSGFVKLISGKKPGVNGGCYSPLLARDVYNRKDY